MTNKDAFVINVCIVDDHPLIRTGIRQLIEPLPYMKISFEAANGLDFLEKLSTSESPHIVILDINMPGMDGYELLPILENQYPDIKPVILSMISGEDALLHLFSMGARACISKSSGIDTLIDVISEVFEKGMCTSNLKLPASLAKQNTITKKGFHGKSYLTPRESLILSLMASELSYTDIAKKLSLEEKTIQNYRDRIYVKLGFKSRNELTLYAIKNGLYNPYM